MTRQYLRTGCRHGCRTVRKIQLRFFTVLHSDSVRHTIIVGPSDFGPGRAIISDGKFKNWKHKLVLGPARLRMIFKFVFWIYFTYYNGIFCSKFSHYYESAKNSVWLTYHRSMDIFILILFLKKNNPPFGNSYLFRWMVFISCKKYLFCRKIIYLWWNVFVSQSYFLFRAYRYLHRYLFRGLRHAFPGLRQSEAAKYKSNPAK